MALRLRLAPNVAAATTGAAALHAFMNANNEKKLKKEKQVVKNIEKWLRARKSEGRRLQKQNIPGLRDKLRKAIKACSTSQKDINDALTVLLDAKEVFVNSMEELKAIENVYDRHDWTVKLWISAPEQHHTQIRAHGVTVYLPIKN